MQDLSRFEVHKQARVRPAEAPQISALLAALQAGASIAVTPKGLIARPEASQQVYVQSSGSTGAPKIIRRCPASWIASFEINARIFGVGPGVCVAVLSDLRHSLALYATVEALHLGAEIACLAGQSPRMVMANLSGVDLLYATPTQLRLLLATGWQAPPSRIVVGGGRVGPDLRARLSDMGAMVYEFYGTSEASFIAISDDNTPPAAVGRAYPGVEIRCDADGLIWVKSPYLFQGYDSEHSDHREDGFVCTGEVGAFTDGYLYLHGRADRMVTVADQNVHPEALEARIAPLLSDRVVAVLSRPDSLRGHVLVAVVSGAPDAALASRIKAVQAPIGVRDVLFWDRLPMLAAGKIDYCAVHQGLSS